MEVDHINIFTRCVHGGMAGSGRLSVWGRLVLDGVADWQRTGWHNKQIMAAFLREPIHFDRGLQLRAVDERTDQRYEQEIDRSTIVVVCQPTPLTKLGRSCVRLWGYYLIIPHDQPKLGISGRVVEWIFLILPQIDSQSSNWVYWIKEGSQQLTSAI